MVTKKRATCYNSKITFHESKNMEPVQPVQVNIYQSSIYREDLSWLLFDDESKIHEKQQV